MEIINEVGKKYGNLKVLKSAKSEKIGAHWLCLCKCGNTRIVSGSDLRRGRKKSCCCLNKTRGLPIIDETGKRYGKLTVIKKSVAKESGKLGSWWICKCDCGNETIVHGRRLRTGHTRSCGCIHRKHGMTNTPEFRSWIGMKSRCYYPAEPSYKHYGGRGIRVAPEWLLDNGFINFFNHVGPRLSNKHSLDRINVNKNYEPGNVRWATQEEQSNNRRKIGDLGWIETKLLIEELRSRGVEC